MRQPAPQFIAIAIEWIEHIVERGVVDRSRIGVSEQVLLADVGDVAVLAILGEQVIEWLVALGADFYRNRFVPFAPVSS